MINNFVTNQFVWWNSVVALFHESNTVEEWESSKVEADMELYEWNRNKSRESCMEILSWGKHADTETPCLKEYSQSVEQLFNDGENEYNLQKYKEAVLKVLGLAWPRENPQPPPATELKIQQESKNQSLELQVKKRNFWFHP